MKNQQIRTIESIKNNINCQIKEAKVELNYWYMMKLFPEFTQNDNFVIETEISILKTTINDLKLDRSTLTHIAWKYRD